MRQGVFNPKLKLLWHCDRVCAWRSGVNIAPVMVEMDLTNKCQLKCDFCTFKYMKDKSDINTEVALKAIQDMVNMRVKSINFTGGGEPTLHKDFSAIVKFASKYGIDLGLFTNGYNLCKNTIDTIIENFHWVRVSIDASNETSFLKTKGVDGFERTINNVIALCKAKKRNHSKCDIGVGFVITPKNYKEIYFFAELFAKMPEIKYIQYKPVIDNLFENRHLEKEWWKGKVEPLLDKTMKDFPKAVINYYKFNDLISDIEREYDICYGHEFCPCIGATGDVWVCTHLREIDGMSFGNLNLHSFRWIWESKERQEVIKKIDIKKCQNYCRNNEINKVLYQLKHGGEEGHYNFI